MSAFGGEADVILGVAKCPLIAKSGHRQRGSPRREWIVTMSAKGHEQTLIAPFSYVRFALALCHPAFF